MERDQRYKTIRDLNKMIRAYEQLDHSPTDAAYYNALHKMHKTLMAVLKELDEFEKNNA